MVDIYDEIGYIKNLLQYGISQKWDRDVVLLARYYKHEGVKKEEAKQKILDKLENAAERKNPEFRITFDKNSILKNRAIDDFNKGWANKEPLRNITEIELSREVVDWFLSLEDGYTVSDEYVEQEKKAFESIGVNLSIKNNILSWSRVKFLFCAYVWTLLQKEYASDKTNNMYKILNLEDYKARFINSAGISRGFKLFYEEVLLKRLGLIYITSKIRTIIKFDDEFDVFKIPITDENRVVLRSDEAGEGDLYFPGEWLERQRNGSFVCAGCGKIEHYSKMKSRGRSGSDEGTRATKVTRAKTYCKSCLRQRQKEEDLKRKEVPVCVDCGCLITEWKYEEGKRARKPKRCSSCQRIRHNKMQAERIRRVRQEAKEAQEAKNEEQSTQDV